MLSLSGIPLTFEVPTTAQRPSLEVRLDIDFDLGDNVPPFGAWKIAPGKTQPEDLDKIRPAIDKLAQDSLRELFSPTDWDADSHSQREYSALLKRLGSGSRLHVRYLLAHGIRANGQWMAFDRTKVTKNKTKNKDKQFITAEPLVIPVQQWVDAMSSHYGLLVVGSCNRAGFTLKYGGTPILYAKGIHYPQGPSGRGDMSKRYIDSPNIEAATRNQIASIIHLPKKDSQYMY